MFTTYPDTSAALLDLDLLEPSTLHRGQTPVPSPALVTAAKNLGVVDAIICRKSRTSDKRYEILRNLLSWRVAQEAQLLKVPATICNVSDRAAAELVRADIESWAKAQERDNPDPITEARRLREEYLAEDGPRHGRMAALARRRGVSRALISQILAFLELPDEVQQLGIGRKLSRGQLRALRGLKEPDQIKLAKQAVREDLSVRAILARAKAAPPKKDPDIDVVERKLKERLGCATSLARTSLTFDVGGDLHVLSGVLDNCAGALPKEGSSTKFDGHKLRISFANMDEFNNFLDKMGVTEQ